MVLNEIKQLGSANFDQQSSDGGSDVRTIPTGRLASYIKSAVPDDALPLYARAVGMSVPQTRTFLETQFQVFAYAAGRDLTEKECSIMIKDDIRARRIGGNIVAGAVGLGLVHLYQAHKNQWPLPLQTRFFPPAFSNLDTFGPLKGQFARTAWASFRLTFYLPIWVVGAQMVVMPLLAWSAMKASMDPDLRRMNEEVSRGLNERKRRGMSMGSIVKESETAAKRAAAVASSSGWASEDRDQDPIPESLLSYDSSRSGSSPPFQDRWSNKAARNGASALDDIMDGSDGEHFNSHPPVSENWSDSKHGVVDSVGERKSWDQIRGSTKTGAKDGRITDNYTSFRGQGSRQPSVAEATISRTSETNDDQTPPQSWDGVRKGALAVKSGMRRDE